MIDPQTLSLFQDAVADPRFPIAIGIAALSGLVRGFSGFGSALIYMPLIAAVYSPRLAAPTLLLIDTICSLPFALHAMPQCNWREVTPVTIGGVVTLPIGVLALLWVDPLSLRWFIAVWCWPRWWRWPPAGAITAARRSPPRSASARSPALAAAPCRSAPRLCWWSGWAEPTMR